jgi:hypothetical protein
MNGYPLSFYWANITATSGIIINVWVAYLHINIKVRDSARWAIMYFLSVVSSCCKSLINSVTYVSRAICFLKYFKFWTFRFLLPDNCMFCFDKYWPSWSVYKIADKLLFSLPQNFYAPLSAMATRICSCVACKCYECSLSLVSNLYTFHWL